TKVNHYGNIYTCLIDMHGADPGMYDVDFITKDSTYHYANGYEQQVRKDALRIEILGREEVRANVDYYYTVRVHNDGNAVAGFAEVFLLAPPSVQVIYLDTLKPTPHVFAHVNPDTVSEVMPVTVENGFPLTGDMRGYVIAGIPQGGYKDLRFLLKFQPGGKQIFVSVRGPYSGSPFFDWVDPCWTARLNFGYQMFNFVADVLPIAHCAWEITKLAYSSANIIYDMASGNLAESGADGATFTSISYSKTLFSALKNCAADAGAIETFGLSEVASITWDVAMNAPKVTEAYYQWLSACDPETRNRNKRDTKTTSSIDPNAKVGPSGYGAQRYINGVDKRLDYSIYFENLAAATAPAQIVSIADTLDKSVFNLSTFRMNAFGFGTRTYPMPMDRNEFANDYPISAQLAVRTVIKLDTATGILKASFVTIDRQTNDLVSDPHAGFLPPNVTAPQGEGYFSYSVEMKDGLPDGTAIRNGASIIFDSNAPIATDVWSNILDRTKPSSHVTSASLLSDTTVMVRVTGGDAASGVESYQLFASANGAAYIPVGVVGDSVRFVGHPNVTYTFYTLAVDSVGNVEAKSPQAEATVTTAKSLAVTMRPLTGIAEGRNNRLNWSTFTETNNNGFYVEKSSDGAVFNTLGFVPSAAANGNSTQLISYVYRDDQPLAQTWYRLKQVDKDGKSAYSNVVLVKHAPDGNSSSRVYPVPAHNTVHIENSRPIQSIRVLEMAGKLVKQLSPNATGTYDISSLAPGIYLFEVTTEGKKENIKVLVQ
ncbi:MAG: T9SS type A sorting domain-containing protein, partial [Bacteroidetes bacterium]|nr:T9SS type A sorting domain-containing protein [Bacteroidota bacterium]